MCEAFSVDTKVIIVAASHLAVAFSSSVGYTHAVFVGLVDTSLHRAHTLLLVLLALCFSRSGCLKTAVKAAREHCLGVFRCRGI